MNRVALVQLLHCCSNKVLKDCHCCRETWMRQREILLTDCYTQDGKRIFGQQGTMVIHLKEPEACTCHKSVARFRRRKDFNDDHVEENTDFIQSIPGFQECDEEDVENWMACDAKDCGFQMKNDDEIVTYVQEESDPVDDEDEGNNKNESSQGSSNAGAFSALETAMEWYEQQTECCPTQLLLL
ncbi:uncharacterized protein TNCV_1815111 [Trichonephila clavipes]|nr:uncharacterized protein TNCV_1815111 [Trichonephila clavipes]